MELDNDSIDERLYNKELATRLNDGIKQAFSFPFLDDEQCQPDKSSSALRDRTFRLHGHLVVLYNIQLLPGLTFRALEVNSGELNVFSHDVKFEVDIPTIAGYFYVVSEDKSVKKPEHIKGTFKINYGVAIAEGIASYFLNNTALGILNMAIDFKLLEKPKVILNSREANGLIGILDFDREGNGAKIADVVWQSTSAFLHWSLRDKLWDVSSKIPWNDKLARDQFYYHEERRRREADDLLKRIVAEVSERLREKTDGGRLEMPDIDVMVAPKHLPETFGRFKATSGWLEDIDSMTVKDHTMVHARSQNELVIVGRIGFDDWKYSYDEYKMTASTGDQVGEITETLDDNEAYITITAIRTNEGEILLRLGKFKYIISAHNFDDNTDFGKYDWLRDYVGTWMSGLMEAKKTVLNELINECLNEVVNDFDMFTYWDELNQHRDTVHVFNCFAFKCSMNYHWTRGD